MNPTIPTCEWWARRVRVVVGWGTLCTQCTCSTRLVRDPDDVSVQSATACVRRLSSARFPRWIRIRIRIWIWLLAVGWASGDNWLRVARFMASSSLQAAIFNALCRRECHNWYANRVEDNVTWTAKRGFSIAEEGEGKLEERLNGWSGATGPIDRMASSSQEGANERRHIWSISDLKCCSYSCSSDPATCAGNLFAFHFD